MLKKPFLRKVFMAVIALALVGGVFFAGYAASRSQSGTKTLSQASQDNKNYYVSFDDYYYEVPKNKAVDDKLVAGGQFIYNLNSAIKINTLDDLFNGGAIGVQSLVPLYGDDQAFEAYVNAVAKPSAESAFNGGTEATFGVRDGDKVKTAQLVSKKDGSVIRRQLMINLSQAVTIVAKDESDEFKSVSRSINRASSDFPDYEDMKLQVLSQSFMLSNHLLDDMYRLAHPELKKAADVDQLKSLVERSKDALTREVKVSGVQINGAQMTATMLFVDKEKPTNNKSGTLTFRRDENKWKLYEIKLPGGVVGGPGASASN